MNLIKVGGAVLNQTPMDWENNKKNILGAIEEARKQNVSILCLPELCITGYGCEDMFYSNAILETAIDVLYELLPYTFDMSVCFGLPLMYQNRIFNTACLVVNGKIEGFAAKRFLAGNGIHYEPRWFTPWPENEKVAVSISRKGHAQNFPLGDLHFNVGGIKIGFEICEDAWVANRPGRKLYQYGVDLILNPSASHFAFGKFGVRKRFVLEGSRAFGVGYVYSNLLGNESGRAIYDGGCIIASYGNLIAEGRRLGFEDYSVTSACIDIASNRMAQSQASTFFNVPKMLDNCVDIAFDFPAVFPEDNDNKGAEWETSDFLQEEEFARAVSLGMYDYMRKSRSNGFVISLSGGADSAAIAALVFLMLKLGAESIGTEFLKKKMSYIKGIENIKNVEEIMPFLLLTAYQGTKNSSDITLTAASEVAKGINAVFHNLNIHELVQGYNDMISRALGRELTWETDDITLQNIQARVRAPGIWMFANIRNALLISTSNRSEAAVGYATMDGDTSGGLSPIAGIDKAFLRRWLVWLEKIGVDGKLTLPALRFINEQQPTAELRPQENKQTDEDDLMPYDILDSIEEAAIRDKKSPLDCYLLLRLQYKQYSQSEIKNWVAKFFRLWSRNQWKRERYAPSFHLDDKNLDPKTWCRFPILSGGFAKEIEAMLKYAG